VDTPAENIAGLPGAPRLLSLVAGVLIVLTACGGGGGGNAGGAVPVAGCTAVLQKQRVLDIMQDWYFWNDEPEQQNKYATLSPAQFATAAELLSQLRFRPVEFDRGFSFITTVEADQQFFSEGQFITFGFTSRFVNPPSNDDLRLTQVFAGSPADLAGLARGYRILQINGRTIAEINQAEGVSTALGPTEEGLSRDFLVEDLAGDQFLATVSKQLITLDPVPDVPSRILDVNGEPVGYVDLKSFISTADAELDNLFAQFRAQSVANVVIDLRYNGGGLVSTAERLADLLAGAVASDQVFSRTRYSSARSNNNSERRFQARPQSLPLLQRVVFITTQGSASASELVINGLAPHTLVALAGAPTFGKPVGQSAFDYCDGRFRLRAVTFELVNGNDEGGFFSGLPQPGSSVAELCAAPDDLNFPQGDPNEASLAAALAYINTGVCPPAAGVQKLRPGSGFHEDIPLPADATPAQHLLRAF
jgi:hypothetical protein